MDVINNATASVKAPVLTTERGIHSSIQKMNDVVTREGKEPLFIVTRAKFSNDYGIVLAPNVNPQHVAAMLQQVLYAIENGMQARKVGGNG